MGLRSRVGKVLGRGRRAAPFDWAVDGGDLGAGPRAGRRASGGRTTTRTLDGRIPGKAPTSPWANNFPIHDPTMAPRVNGKFASPQQAATAGKKTAAEVVAPRKSWARRHPKTAIGLGGTAAIVSGTSLLGLKRNQGPGAVGNGYRPVGMSSGGGGY